MSESKLIQALGVDLSDERLTLALTHRSYAYENGRRNARGNREPLPSNERLEFLGDAVLQLVITDELYHRYPERSEGDLSKLRAGVVNTQVLADIARKLSLGSHLRIGRGEASTGGADKSSILADGMESLFGAIYLQHGMDKARPVILRLLGAALNSAATAGASLDYKTSLQELTAARGLGSPSYVTTSAGPDHAKVFTASVVVKGIGYKAAQGRNKKEAEQQAASVAYKELMRLWRTER
jgi:ribonuclease III